MTNLKVGVLGGGSWGTTVASLVTRNAPVTLWARNPETVKEINTQHTNATYLPGASIPVHEHIGFEHILILHGVQQDDKKVYSKGTLVIHKPGSQHRIRSPEGCIALGIWQKPVKFLP